MEETKVSDALSERGSEMSLGLQSFATPILQARPTTAHKIASRRYVTADDDDSSEGPLPLHTEEGPEMGARDLTEAS